MAPERLAAASGDLFDDASILPPDPVDDEGAPLDALHDREYRIRAFRKADDVVLLRGAVRDQKPPGLYLADDPDPMTIHHMQIDLEVTYPTFEITAAEVLFQSHPHDQCVGITDHYRQLVGLSIARGFTHRVRELFGGPRGCTHTTALLQAMAPVAIQCTFSLRASALFGGADESVRQQARQAMWRQNLNTCHVWAEDGELVQHIEAGAPPEVPLFIRNRYQALGLDPGEWPPVPD